MSKIPPIFVLRNKKTAKLLNDMAKVIIKSENITTFGGIFHIMELFERLDIGKLIDSTLGMRNKSWNSYMYSNIFETFFCNYLYSGDCLEDISVISEQLHLRPNAKMPNSDTVGSAIKSLASDNVEYKCVVPLHLCAGKVDKVRKNAEERHILRLFIKSN